MSSTTFCSLPTTLNFRSKTAFVRSSHRFDTRNRRKLHTAYNPDLGARATRRTTPVPVPHQSTLRRMCHLYSAGLPSQCLVEIQLRDRLSTFTRIAQRPNMPGFPSQVCRLKRTTKCTIPMSLNLVSRLSRSFYTMRLCSTFQFQIKIYQRSQDQVVHLRLKYCMVDTNECG